MDFWNRSVYLLATSALVGALGASCGDSESTATPANAGGGSAAGGSGAQAGQAGAQGGQGGGLAPEPFKDYQPDPSVFSEPASDWIPVGDNKVAAHQLVVVFRSDATDTQRAAAAEAVNGKWVGQIAPLGLYQLHLEAGSLELLRTAASTLRAQPSIDAVTFNYLLRPLVDRCPADDDNLQFTSVEGCAFTDIDYYAAGAMLDSIRQHKTLSRVKVAVLDTGLEVSNGQFDNVPLVNVNNPASPLKDEDGHGTAVGSLIAADDRDGVVNGVATRLTGGLVDLAFAGLGDGSLSGALTALYQAVHGAKAVVANLSLGVLGEEEDLEMKAMHAAWRLVFSSAPNTLFIIAAGNEPVELTKFNVLPAGVKLDNTIVVGGTASCDPLHEYPDSVYGAMLDIAAPAMGVPAATPIPDQVELLTGTSFAAPLVTSLAVVLKSLAPELSAKDLRRYILDNSYKTADKVGGRRLILTEPIAQLLVDKGGPQELLQDFDTLDPTGEADSPGVILTRLCGGAHLEVDDTGSFDFPSDPDNGSGTLNSLGLVLLFQSPDQSAALTVHLKKSLALGTEFSVPDSVTLTFTNSVSSTSGSGTSGSLRLDTCRIVEREGYTDTPLVVEITGGVGGMMDVQKPPTMEPVPTQFHASFATLVTAMGDATLNGYLDANCDGGKKK